MSTWNTQTLYHTTWFTPHYSLLIQLLPNVYPGRQKVTAQVLEFLPPAWRSSRLLALAQPSLATVAIWTSERKLSISICVSFFDFQLVEKKLKIFRNYSSACRTLIWERDRISDWYLWNINNLLTEKVDSFLGLQPNSGDTSIVLCSLVSHKWKAVLTGTIRRLPLQGHHLELLLICLYIQTRKILLDFPCHLGILI